MTRAPQHEPRRGTRLTDERFEFSFDGRTFPAQRGDTAASALLANGIRMFGRSIKCRRARGVLTAGAEEPNALVTVGTVPTWVPNVPATQLEVQPGMQLSSQNRWPSLGVDLASMLQLGSGFLGAGFYYKTFIWPSWRFYEPMIRRLAGLGPAPGACVLTPPAVRNLSCDVLVAGAGPAGIAAALAAARAGARVVLCERDAKCGGELEFEAATIDGRPAGQWVAAALEALQQHRALVLTSTAVLGGSDGMVAAIQQPHGLPGANTSFHLRPQAFVAAMGSVERPLAFVDNDMPGVMMLGAAERYLGRHGVRVGQRLVLFGNHDRLYAAARRLMAGGMHIAAIVDVRLAECAESSRDMRSELERAGTPCLLGHAVTHAVGWRTVNGARVAALGTNSRPRTFPCDVILMSGGWSPAVHAGLSGGGTSTYLADVTAFAAHGQPQGRSLCGAANGVFELGAVLSDGHAAGMAAAAGGGKVAPGVTLTGSGDAAPHVEAYWRSPATRAEQKKQFVDFQNDVTIADLQQALIEGFTDIEHVKRYTTLGVGTDQGRTSSVLGSAIIAELSSRPLAEIGHFKTRPPYQPATLNTLAGVRAGMQLRPTRRTPLHSRHASSGAVLEPMGLWFRPRYYGDADAFATACAEAKRVRAHGGIFDGSTLGKIEARGPDAAEFLDRLYLTRVSNLRVGRSKYGVNLREDGMVLDDGIVVRLERDHFLLTTSTGHAEHMLSHFEFYRDTEWSGRRLSLTDVTDAWAVIGCAGPASRSALIEVLGSEWCDRITQLTHMGCVSGITREAPVRLLRAGFSGELAFELHCRPRAAPGLWDAMLRAGLAPYGLEALDILRVEKGYLVGAELNGQTSPFDLGMEAFVKLGNPCVGRDLLQRPALIEPNRARLVGIRAADARAKLVAGAQLTTRVDPARSLGHVTSAVYSPALGEWIGLALLAGREAEVGAVLVARDPVRSGDTAIRVVSPVHFDVAGERMKV